MAFDKLFKVKQIIIDEIKELEDMTAHDIVDVALRIKDQTISDIEGLFGSIVTTIEQDIKSLEDGLISIENSLFDIINQQSIFEKNKKIILGHKEELETKLGTIKNIVETWSNNSEPVGSTSIEDHTVYYSNGTITSNTNVPTPEETK